ncbi:hypothetical protein HK102_010076 [Quaeritorhiza haematococci]|nr:hypothetical protein HK102_010076 [Quaeritorhiza haematococci]
MTVKSDPELAKKVSILARQLQAEQEDQEEGSIPIMNILNGRRASQILSGSRASQIVARSTSMPRTNEVAMGQGEGMRTEPLGWESSTEPRSAIDRPARGSLKPRLSLKIEEEKDQAQVMDGEMTALEQGQGSPGPRTRWHPEQNVEYAPPAQLPADRPVFDVSDYLRLSKHGLELQTNVATSKVLEKQAGGSEASDMSEKNLRIKVHKRKRMALVLKNYIEKFSVYQLCMVILFVGLTAGVFGLSVYIFSTYAESNSMFTVSMRVPRRIMEVTTNMRYMNLYSMANNTERDLMHILVDIDEAIEEINEDMAAEDEDTDKDFSNVVAKSLVESHEVKDKTFVYMRNYIGLVVVLLLCVVAMICIPLVRSNVSEHIVNTLNFVGKRRTYACEVNFVATEVTAQDTNFWQPGEIEMELQYLIRKFEALHINAKTGVGEQSIQPLAGIPALSQILTTYEPVDALIDRFISEAHLFLAHRHNLDDEYGRKQNLTEFLNHPSLILMRGLLPDILQGLEDTQDIMFHIEIDDNAEAQQIIVGIAVATAVVAIFAYFFVFSAFAKERLSQADQVVNLIFMLPQTVIDSKAELKRFIESAGISAASDEQ